MRTTLFSLLLFILPGTLLIPWGTVQTAAPPRSEPHRSPLDLALLPDGRHALTANHTSDSVSLLDLGTGTILTEKPCGHQPAGVACSRDGKVAAVSNLGSGTISLFAITPTGLSATGTVSVGALPRGLAFSAAGSLFVAVSGADQVVKVDPARRTVLARWPAAREPYSLAASLDGRWIACASSRSGHIRLFEADSGKLIQEQQIGDAFNLRGLIFSPDGQYLVCAHTIRRDFPVTQENVGKGWVIDNRLTRLRLEQPAAGPVLEQLSLDPRGKAAGDPHGVAFSPDGKLLAVTTAGTGEVFVFQTKALGWTAAEPGDLIDPDLLWNDGRFRRHFLGGRPLALTWSPSGELVAANQLLDGVQLVHPTSGKVVRRIALGGPEKPGLVRQGEALFHDARRSHHQWFSCHTCHPAGHTSGQKFDTLNDDAFGDAKLVPTLRGVAETAPYTWHGWQNSLEDAVRKSFLDTMYGEAPTRDEVRAVVAYLTSLKHPPIPARPGGRLSAAAARGEVLFEGKARCARCHEAPTYTTPRNFDVKLQHDGSPYEGWNPPSLRGLWDRGPFLHDGRSSILEDVLTRWHTPNHIGGTHLTPAERADLIAFLNSL